MNIVMSRAPGTDPVTRTLAIALALVHVQIDARFWSQSALSTGGPPHSIFFFFSLFSLFSKFASSRGAVISFAFVGVIMVTSLRSFILQLMKVHTRSVHSVG